MLGSLLSFIPIFRSHFEVGGKSAVYRSKSQLLFFLFFVSDARSLGKVKQSK